jgi:hypothetical protein
VDRNPYKQGKYTPGTHIPILMARTRSRRNRPDYIFILPWNLRTEITAQMSYVQGVGLPSSSSRSPIPKFRLTTDRRAHAELHAGFSGDAIVLCLGAHCDDIEIGCGGAL